MKRLIAIVLFCVLVPVVYGDTIYWRGGTYIGEVSNNRPHGQGSWSQTTSSPKKYVGEWQDGNPYGLSTYTFANGNKYVGDW